MLLFSNCNSFRVTNVHNIIGTLIDDTVAITSNNEYTANLHVISNSLQQLQGVRYCLVTQGGSHFLKIRLHMYADVFTLLQRQQKEQGIDRPRYSASWRNLSEALEKYARPVLVALVEAVAGEIERDYLSDVRSQQSSTYKETFLKSHLTKKTGNDKKGKEKGKGKGKGKDSGGKPSDKDPALGGTATTTGIVFEDEQRGVYPNMDNVAKSADMYLPLGVQLLSAYSQYALEQDIGHLDITSLCGIIRNCSYLDRYDRTVVDAKTREQRTVNDLRRISDDIREARNFVSHRDIDVRQPKKGFDAIEELIELFGNNVALLSACQR